MTAPDTPMRQPPEIRITPSNRDPWYGSAKEGDRFTAEQLAVMARDAIDPETVEAILVKRTATDREMWWPVGDFAPVFQFECPVLHRRPDGRVKVLAPGGWPKIVFGDGWVRRPHKRPKRGSIFA